MKLSFYIDADNNTSLIPQKITWERDEGTLIFEDRVDGTFPYIWEKVRAVQHIYSSAQNTANLNFITDSLPAGTRFFSKYSDSEYYVIEIPPKPCLIRTTQMSRGVLVSMPWQYFILGGRNLTSQGSAYSSLDVYYLFWAPKRIQSLDDTVYSPYVPNTSYNGSICFGTTSESSYLPIKERVEKTVHNFYTRESVFNEDLGWHFPIMDDGRFIQSFKEWAGLSKINPPIWKKFKYDSMGRIRDFLPDPSGMGSPLPVKVDWTPFLRTLLDYLAYYGRNVNPDEVHLDEVQEITMEEVLPPPTHEITLTFVEEEEEEEEEFITIGGGISSESV